MEAALREKRSSELVVWAVEATLKPIWYGWPKQGKSSFDGGRRQSDVWEFDRHRVDELHPTQKPLALVEPAIANSSRPGDIVLDPFLGSGSTLTAAERTGRACYGVELDPAIAPSSSGCA